MGISERDADWRKAITAEEAIELDVIEALLVRRHKSIEKLQKEKKLIMRRAIARRRRKAGKT